MKGTMEGKGEKWGIPRGGEAGIIREARGDSDNSKRGMTRKKGG